MDALNALNVLNGCLNVLNALNGCLHSCMPVIETNGLRTSISKVFVGFQKEGKNYLI